MVSEIAVGYERFADSEARNRSPLYEKLARHVAASSEIQTFLSKLPVERRQPNLLFAATRFVSGTPRDAQDFEQAVIHQGSEIAGVMLQRTTQTNEPGRCAVLLTALAQIEGAIALIEVGTSAGLCLLPDRYGYDWGRAFLHPGPEPTANSPLFPCAASDSTPLPDEFPSIVWRSGIDLNPLDVNDRDDVALLETLVWPEDTSRLHRLRAAMEVARKHPPTVHKGDLRHDLQCLIEMAPADATVVVFHTAVLSYVTSEGDRNKFAQDLLSSGTVWLCNESPRVFPEFAAQVGEAPSNGLFLMSRNGKPIAWTGPHGQCIHWLED